MRKRFIRQFLVILLFCVIFPDFAFCADLSSMVNKIFSWLQTALVSIGVLIIVAVGIYFMKNLERWKEVFLTCIGLIGAALILMNAQSIAQFFFSN